MTSRSDRTEKPTPKRLRDAKRKGQVPKSQEVSTAIGLLLLAITVRLIAPLSGGVVVDETAGMLRSAGTGNIGASGSAIVKVLAATLLPVLTMAVFAAIVAGVGQVGLLLAPEAAKPKLSNLSPKRGLEKFKPSKAAWELARSGLKIGLLVVLSIGPLTGIVETVASRRGLGAGVSAILDAGWQILLRIVIAMLIIAVADYAIARYRNRKDLRMTKDELRRELRESDGSPEMKAARRRRASELSRNRMISAASTADVVVTNPTHLAVGLKYEDHEPAPRVVSKGANELAKRIRKEARRNGVPIFEDKPLARALFRRVKVGDYVPTTLFEAVALILAMAYRRRVPR